MKNNSIIINYFMRHHNGKKHLFVIKNNSLIAIIFKIDILQIANGYIMIAYKDITFFIDSDAKVEIH